LSNKIWGKLSSRPLLQAVLIGLEVEWRDNPRCGFGIGQEPDEYGAESYFSACTEHTLWKSWAYQLVQYNATGIPQIYLRLISLWMGASLEKFELAILQRTSPTSQLQWPPRLSISVHSYETNYGYRFPKEQPPGPRSRNLRSWAGVSLFLHGTEGVSATTRPLKFKSVVRKETRSIRIPIVYGVVEVMGHFRSTYMPHQVERYGQHTFCP
jgi:hypothetical protein